MTTLRIAAAQLDFHAAFEGGGVMALREPTGALEGRGLSGLRTGDRELDGRLRCLREQVERAYLDGYQPRLEAIIRFCFDLGVDLLVLPEYAVPLALLPAVVEAAGPTMTVVAGSHTVTVDGWRRSGIYERLGLSSAEDKPVIGSAVAPVLRGGRAVALQPKLSASRLDPDLIPGRAFTPLPLGEAQLGVLVALDFFRILDPDVASLVAAGLEGCDVFAVPTLSPFSTLSHVELRAEERFATRGRPVIYATHARDGGTQIVTPESAAQAILAAGRPPALPPGAEGVVVADVHLGKAAQHNPTLAPSRPVAAAALLDARAFRDLKAAADAVLAATDVPSAFERIEQAAPVFQAAAGSARLPEVARARFRYLADGAEGTQRLEHLKALVRDIWVEGITAPDALDKGLVEGALRVLRNVERHKPDAADVAAARASLEQEAQGRRRDAAAPSAVVEQVTKDLLSETETEPETEPERSRVPPSSVTGSFERWILDPGELPEQLRQRGFVGWPADEVLSLNRPRAESDEPEVDIDPRAALLGAAQKTLRKAAGLLALSGLPPAWVALHERKTPALVLRGGRVVFVTEGEPPAELIARATPDEPVRSRRGVELPVVISGKGPPVPVGVTSLKEAIRALGRKGPHLQSLSDFLDSPEGERFVKPDARVRGGDVDDAGEHLKAWLKGPQPVCLLLGEDGIGKSTTARAFAALCALDAMKHGERPVVFVDLRTWSGPLDLADIVRRALGERDVASVRFAVESGECVLILDGLDELRAGPGPRDLAGELRALFAWRTPESKVLLTCRTDLLFDPAEASAVFAEPAGARLRREALAPLAGAALLELLPFDEAHVRYYLERVYGAETDAAEAWDVLHRVDGLEALARRPLLLDMSRSTLRVLRTKERVGVSDLYEAYIQLWSVFAGTQQRLSPEERIAFVEALARRVFEGGEGALGDGVPAAALFGPESAALPEPLQQKLARDPAAQREILAGPLVLFRDGLYRLSHLSFVDYLVARRAIRALAKGDVSALDLPPFSAEMIGHCAAQPGWGGVQGALLSTLLSGYRPRVSENAFLLVHAGGALSSSKERPYRLEGAKLDRVDLRGARLNGARLIRASFEGAKLDGARAAGAWLEDAALDRADLRGADLRDARLRGARLRGAKLDGARLDGADLSAVRLEGSTAYEAAPRLVKARMDGAAIGGTAWLEPARGVELRRVLGAAEARWRGEVTEVARRWPARGGAAVALAVHWGAIHGAAFSRDGARIATACADGVVRVWEASTGRLLLLLEGHEAAVEAVAFSPDGDRLASASWDRTVRLWDALTGQRAMTLQGHRAPVRAVAFSSGGQLLSAASDRSARAWDARSGQLLRSFQVPLDDAAVAAFSADGASLAVAQKGAEVERGAEVETWDVPSGRLLLRTALEGGDHDLTAVALSSDRARLATAGARGAVQLWDASSGRRLPALGGRAPRSTAVAFSADGARLVTASTNRAVRVWEASTGRSLLALPGRLPDVSPVSLSADGAHIAVGLSDGTTCVWAAATGQLVGALRGHASAIRALSFSADGHRVGTLSWDNTAQVWEVPGGARVAAFSTTAAQVAAAAFSPDGAILAVAPKREDIVQVWEAQTGRLLRSLPLPGAAIMALALSRGGARLAVSLGRTVQLWDMASGQMALTLPEPASYSTHLALSPDAAYLVTASHLNEVVTLWDAPAGRPICALPIDGSLLRAVVFSPDGARLGTASADATRIWEVATGRLLSTLPSTAAATIAALSFSPDNARLVTTSPRSLTRILDAASGRELATLHHLPHGGVATAGSYAALSGDADLDAFVVRTGARCAPLALYRDVCVRPDLVAEALANRPVPALSIPMDRAERRAEAPVTASGELFLPADLSGGELINALALFAARRDHRLAERTLARCSARVEGSLRAGAPGAISIAWSLPEGLDRAPGFSRSAKVLLPQETAHRPLDLGDAEAVAIPACSPGRVAIALTFFLDGAERTLELSLTAYARNPYIVGSPITDPRDFYGRAGFTDLILAALEDDSVAVRGEVRIGKTSLLHQLARAAGPSAEMISLQPYAGRFARFLPDLARRLAPAREGTFSDAYEELDAAVSHRLATTSSSGRRARLILIVDEVQFLAHAWELRHQFRGLLQERKAEGLRALVAGPGSGLRALAADPDASAFLNMFQPFYLGPMSAEEVTRLVRAPLGPEITITDAAVVRVVALAGGRPLVAQILCRHALDRVRREGRDQIDADVIDRVLHEVAFHDLVHNFYAYPARWAALPLPVQGALLRVAALPEPARAALDTPTLKLLAEHDLADVHQRKLDAEPTFLMWIREEAQ